MSNSSSATFMSGQEKNFRNRQYFNQLILNELAAGLHDHEVSQKLQIPLRTYYRYKHNLADKIAYFQNKVSERDIALANEIYEQRILKLYSIALQRAQDSNTCKDPEFLSTAAQLATNLLVMKKQGLIEATSKRANLERQREQQRILQQENDGLYSTVF